MQGIERVAILVNKPMDCWEGLRSTLGLLVENLWGGCFIIDCEIKLPADKREEDFAENLEMLEDLEGQAVTNVKANAERFEFLEYMPLEEMVEQIKTYQLVVPF